MSYCAVLSGQALSERVIDVENPETDFIKGRELRKSSPRSALAELIPSPHAATEILIARNANRLPELVPMRFAPMLADPFSFYRGSAAVMAADMATKLTAARQLTRYAADRYDSGERCDMEAGMAKLFASEVAMEIALNAVRIHGGYGYSTEYDFERYFCDAPLMMVGAGTNEIRRNVIAGQLVSRGGI